MESDQVIGMIDYIAVFVIPEFCRGSIRERVLLLSLKWVLYFWSKISNHKNPYDVLNLGGFQKGYRVQMEPDSDL